MFIKPTHEQVVTVREAIGNLPPIGAGEENLIDRLLLHQGLSELNLQRVTTFYTWRKLARLDRKFDARVS